MERIIGVDPGSERSGLIVLDDSAIMHASVSHNVDGFWCNITNFLDHQNLMVVIEDIKPYSMTLMPQVIQTSKFIGELLYRLKILDVANVKLITRWDVKKWCFENYPDICLPEIKKKMARKKKKDDSYDADRTPTAVYVDDKMVKKCMVAEYKIPVPKPGDGYKYGLQDDSWQALGLVTCFRSTRQKEVLTEPDQIFQGLLPF